MTAYYTRQLNPPIALQQDLLAMQTWEGAWLMRFDISKCFVMRVTQSTQYKVIAT